MARAEAGREDRIDAVAVVTPRMQAAQCARMVGPAIDAGCKRWCDIAVVELAGDARLVDVAMQETLALVQTQRARDLAVAEPGLEARFDQLGDRRARHQGALVALETQAGEPGLAGQVGGRDAFVDAALEQFQHAQLFGLQQARLANQSLLFVLGDQRPDS